ncbi:DNA polymerase IV [Altererythrobacter epoxidivorans]|uniref:DNA polymerase IV n=1 Tax=Altererythrobacter epoxidivorans TaxID=361183 RepID=A0A0M3T9Q0_9SPHN|nr:DNA polymerase IV [Altererythrobacter epoxidivorans]ALE15682.1 DNA polymerase IV [Altererythrobacter epoxidivorans]
MRDAKDTAATEDDGAEAAMGLRKIIHVDMDAFFASVEQRDNPELQSKPIAVGGSGGRGVVAAASYEARKFGVRSAMPSVTAKRLCPDLIFVRHRFDAYKEASRTIRRIFEHYTPHVEPLSLDEAYLDVTDDLLGIGSATRIAQLIRQEIKAKTRLTASAGVSYNKFLAKIASDQNKPNGMCVIRPGEGADFVAQLPVRRFHGVGPKGAEKMAKLGIETGGDLAAKDIEFLRANFGSMGDYLFRAARGIDLRPVRAHRERKSVGGERTFSEDISSGPALRETLENIIDIVWDSIERSQAKGRTVTLKMKYTDFQTMTRAKTVDHPVADKAEFSALARTLLDEVLPLPMPIRLMGLTLSKLEGKESAEPPRDDAQLSLL